MTHRRISDAEDPTGALRLSVPYCVEVHQDGALDQSNRIPWSRVFLVEPSSRVNIDSFHDIDHGTRHALTPGSGWFLPAGRRYRFRFTDGLQMIAWHLRLGWTGIDDACRLVTYPQPVAQASELHARASAALAAPAGRRTALLRACLLDAVAPFISMQARPDPRIAPALDRIAQGAGAGMTVAELAIVCRLRRETFTRIFTRSCGISPHEALHASLVAEAVSLLGAGTAVATVADQLGFTSPSACSRFIKARTGMAPRGIRSNGCYGTLR